MITTRGLGYGGGIVVRGFGAWIGDVASVAGNLSARQVTSNEQHGMRHVLVPPLRGAQASADRHLVIADGFRAAQTSAASMPDAREVAGNQHATRHAPALSSRRMQTSAARHRVAAAGNRYNPSRGRR